MSRLIDALSDAGQRWTAWSGAEAAEAMRVCMTYFENVREGLRAFVAYSFIASKRDPDTLHASVSDTEAAGVVPKVRGSGFLARSAFQRSIKRDLRACGLLDYKDAPKNSRAGRECTEYEFPMLEKLIDRLKAEKAQAIKSGGYSLGGENIIHTTTPQPTNNYSHAQVNNLYIDTGGVCEQPFADIHTSRTEKLEVKNACIEEGIINNPASLPKWQPYNPPETCPYCGAHGSTGWAMVGGVDYVYCSACGTQKLMADWENAKYSALQAAPDIPF